MDAPLWRPSADRIAASQLAGFHRSLVGAGVLSDEPYSYAALHRFSIEEPAAFWGAAWRWCGVIGDWPEGSPVVQHAERMAPPDPVLGPTWFPEARLNFAENLLRFSDDRPALVSWTEAGRLEGLTYADLGRAVREMSVALARVGIVPGDRVVGFLPNTVHAVIAMLGAASLGATWSSCSPDFGVNGVLDRFGQVAPKVLIVADGYRYGGKVHDCLERTRGIVAAIDAIEHVVVVPLLERLGGTRGDLAGIRGGVWWDAFVRPSSAARGAPPEQHDTITPSREHHASTARPSVGVTPPQAFPRFPFDHPLYIMYSSGTTGLPKCMVHGAGGTLLQHLKEHQLHVDLTRDDTIFYFSTCGWMMWNWLVSALATGATVVLYDGAPMAPALRPGRGEAAPGPDLLWQMAEEERITVFGTSAKYLALAEKEGLRPRQTRDLDRLRAVLSTGSPLAPPSFDYVYRDIGDDLQLASISGGTDIISCFALGNPTAPVWRGELQAAGLGMCIDTFDERGASVRGTPGELVCTRPFPSMPVAFWNDPDGAKYRAAYFDTWPGVWRHGDWAEWTAHEGLVITGRSDATLNPGGVRIGTAEIYRQVEQLPEVVESLVVGQEVGDARERDVRIVLFVRLREGVVLDDPLRDRIRRHIRANTSPHHVPKVIVQVADIPRTISGKITELAVRDVIHGRPVKNTDALANPAALELFRDLPELRPG
ncbi:MAG: acetoacetate--CoA ligase [Gemmatimonadetes bacterium]|nr:acetoacetate--CoA ligase [Gemmatimonadota bacterium]